jgi:nucleotide-binding universal stress UspA family protein
MTAVRDILFHLDAREPAQSAGDFALSLAAATGAHLTAAGVVIEYPPPVAEIGGFNPAWDFGGGGVFAEMFERSREAVERSFKRLTERAPPEVQTELVTIQGFPEVACEEFARLARCFDLSVISQGPPSLGEAASLMISGALFGSGRPIFLVPFVHNGEASLEKAIVCWDGGVQAARAVAAALPLLSQARRVEVVHASPDRERSEQIPAYGLMRHLARHGIDVELRILPQSGDVGAALLAYASESAASYMVMGAYGHWRLKELVLGGVTRSVITSTTTPAFMVH